MLDCIHFYKVKDLEKARTFYQDTMRMPLYKDQGKCLIFDAEFGKIGFCTHFPEAFSEQSCVTFVYETVFDIDKLYTRFREEGLAVEPPCMNEYFMIYHFFMKDPNGIKLEFQCFVDESRECQ